MKPPRHRRTALSLADESFSGKILGGRYRIEQFVRADLHADNYILSLLDDDDDDVRFAAKAYRLDGLCPKARQSRRRHMLRALAKSTDIVEQGGRRWLVLQELPAEGKCSKGRERATKARTQQDEPQDQAAKAIVAADGGFVAAELDPALVDLILAVVNSTNNIVRGEPDRSTGQVPCQLQAMPSSRQLEDQLRNDRLRLLEALMKSPAKADLLAAISTRLQAWDRIDAKYRQELHQFGTVLPYGAEMQRISAERGATSYIRALEHSRRQAWASFLESAIELREEACKEAFVLEPSTTYAQSLARPQYQLLSKEMPDAQAPVSRKGVKQREKRRRRREARRQATDDGLPE